MAHTLFSFSRKNDDAMDIDRKSLAELLQGLAETLEEQKITEDEVIRDHGKAAKFIAAPLRMKIDAVKRLLHLRHLRHSHHLRHVNRYRNLYIFSHGMLFKKALSNSRGGGTLSLRFLRSFSIQEVSDHQYELDKRAKMAKGAVKSFTVHARMRLVNLFLTLVAFRCTAVGWLTLSESTADREAILDRFLCDEEDWTSTYFLQHHQQVMNASTMMREVWNEVDSRMLEETFKLGNNQNKSSSGKSGRTMVCHICVEDIVAPCLFEEIKSVWRAFYRKEMRYEERLLKKTLQCFWKIMSVQLGHEEYEGNWVRGKAVFLENELKELILPDVDDDSFEGGSTSRRRRKEGEAAQEPIVVDDTDEVQSAKRQRTSSRGIEEDTAEQDAITPNNNAVNSNEPKETANKTLRETTENEIEEQQQPTLDKQTYPPPAPSQPGEGASSSEQKISPERSATPTATALPATAFPAAPTPFPFPSPSPSPAAPSPATATPPTTTNREGGGLKPVLRSVPTPRPATS